MSELSAIEVSKRESSILRSKKRANEFCSFVCAHRLLDVLAYLKKEKDLLSPPIHKKMGIDLPKNDIRISSNFMLLSSHNKQKNLRTFANWTTTLKKFKRNYIVYNTDFNDIEEASNLPGDEQSGALHMFTSFLANFALPTSPRSSLGTQSSCSRILHLSTVPPIDPAVSPTPTQCPTS